MTDDIKSQPGFCYEIFKNLAFWSTKNTVGYNPCSFFNGYITTSTDPKQAWFGPERHAIINSVMQGELIPGCSSCYQAERAGLTSRRMSSKELYENYHKDADINLTDAPRALDYSVGNLCNLKCTICYPATSSSVNQDHKELLKRGLESPWGNEQFPNYDWYTDERGDWLASLPDLREVYLTGGEPMMVKGLHSFLKKLDSSVEIRFNTNGTIINPNVYEELKRFETVNMCFSIDGIGKVNDYIRWGSDWKSIEQNMFRWAEFVKYKSIGPTVQVMNILDGHNLEQWAKQHDFEIWPNMLYNPQYFNVKNAPDTIKSQAKYFPEWVSQDADEEQQKLFVKVIHTFDKLRNTKINNYIPEVAEAYGIN